MKRPRFITFTGIDDSVDFKEIQNLSNHYPIEWGVLFSKTQAGQGRFASVSMLEKLVTYNFNSNVSLAAHICGSYARSFNAHDDYPFGGGIYMEIMQTYLEKYLLSLKSLKRIQINVSQKEQSLENIRNARDIHDLPEVILQCRDATFPPAEEGINYLFDRSGGTGNVPDSWPLHDSNDFVGFAGGIGPENVLEVLSALNTTSPFWIDMESKIRTNDRLDLQKCLDVCKQVYE